MRILSVRQGLLLVLLENFFWSVQCEPSIISKNAKIVDGVDRVTGTGLDNSLKYVSPDSFYGPESLYVLHGACFVSLVDR